MTDSAHGNRHIEVLADLPSVTGRGAELFVHLAEEACMARGRFTVALSGGSTPKALHSLLAAPPHREQVDWAHVQFYWGDERCVPPDDAESNYRMARETLLATLPLRAAQIHRVHTELNDPYVAAVLYEQDIRQGFGLHDDQVPRFDLVLLGMGPDGHTASLFPHTAALAVTDRLVVANAVPQLATTRITMTTPVLNNAAVVAFLVAGADKAPALAAVLEGPADPDTYPAQRIAPTNGTLYWFIDKSAAQQLRHPHHQH